MRLENNAKWLKETNTDCSVSMKTGSKQWSPVSKCDFPLTHLITKTSSLCGLCGDIRPFPFSLSPDESHT